jgi:MFS family permease
VSGSGDSLSAWAPLRVPAFRVLWSVALVANVCMWMNDVSAAWMMSQLTDAPLWIGLVQTAAMLPVFLLGLPSGALADGLDRRQFLLLTQLWISLTALVLCLAVYFDWISPPLLLSLVFLNGIGLAMRMPVLAAILPEVVPRIQLPAAMALGAVSMNASRIIGPIAAGALMAVAGSAWVFAVNALLSLLTAGMLLRWQRPQTQNPLGPEQLPRAMRVGVQYVAHSRHLKGVLLRMALFFLCTAALMALLPLLAQRLRPGGPWTFTLLIAAMGAGAIASTSCLPRWRRHFDRDALVLRGTIVQALSLLGMAWVTELWLAIVLMAAAGGAWITTGNTLSVASQLGLPDWVRARGMSISQVTLMGASAAGAALWGQVAAWSGVSTSLVVAALLLMISMVAVQRLWPDRGIDEDLTPRQLDYKPQAQVMPGKGQVMMEIEYQVDPAQMEPFLAFMLGENRSSRLRHGSLSWELKQDLGQSVRFVETVVDASWNDHLRHFERMTGSDLQLRERRLSFHAGPGEPVVRRYLLASTVRHGVEA